MCFERPTGEENMTIRKEAGFALIAALLTVWILTALGLLIFTVTTQDVRVSSRLVGEKKAFFAAEAGVHNLALLFEPLEVIQKDTAKLNLKYEKTTPTDTTKDSNSKYTIGTPTIPKWGPGSVPVPGSEAGQGAFRFLVQVNGTNAKYGSVVQVGVGIGFGPVNVTTNQP